MRAREPRAWSGTTVPPSLDEHIRKPRYNNCFVHNLGPYLLRINMDYSLRSKDRIS
jgi:hypothetical protein